MIPVAEFHDVGFAYRTAAPRRGRPFALEGVSFALMPGEVLGLIGPNSAGKTTLVRLLTKVLIPTAGTIAVGGIALGRLRAAAVARQIAVVPQELPRAFPFTVRELVLMGRYPHDPGRLFETDADRAIAEAAMTATDVRDLADVSLALLSGGERQRAVIARALAQEPHVLVLDEPTAHLDLRYQAHVADLLRGLRDTGLAVLLVSHDLDLAAALADRLLVLAEGQVQAVGRVSEVLEPATLARAFGCEVAVHPSPVSGRPMVQVVWERRPARPSDAATAGREGR